jgi:cysteine desulfurase family protein
MDKIYFDNGSTSFPKAPGVGKAMCSLVEHACFNINRGGYEGAYELADTVFDTRERLCALFNFPHPQNVVFMPSVTFSLNFLLKGLLRQGDHVIVSSMEHNAVMRPLTQLSAQGVEFTALPCARDGSLDPVLLETALRPNTRAVVMTHASNVCGTVMPIEEVGRFCKAHNLFFILDSAQSAGVIPIDFQALGLSALAFTGHKGLLGPQGIGGMIVTDELAGLLDPLVSGGTGSLSHSEEIPSFLPDKLEPGTQNLPGIVGLNAALQYLEQTGPEAILEKELSLTGRFIAGLDALQGVRLAGKRELQGRTSVVSLDFEGLDNAQVAFLLDSQYGIMTRCGLHCAPRAHKTLGTYPQGTVRFAFGHFNTPEQVDQGLEALEVILRQLRQ